MLIQTRERNCGELWSSTYKKETSHTITMLTLLKSYLDASILMLQKFFFFCLMCPFKIWAIMSLHILMSFVFLVNFMFLLINLCSTNHIHKHIRKVQCFSPLSTIWPVVCRNFFLIICSMNFNSIFRMLR